MEAFVEAFVKSSVESSVESFVEASVESSGTLFSVEAYLLYHWKPVLGTKLPGFSMGRGLGALKGLSFHGSFHPRKL